MDRPPEDEPLAAICTAIAAKVVSATGGLDELTENRTAGRPIARLAAQLRMFAAVVGQLRQWLEMASAVSDPLRDSMRSALTCCSEIVTDLDESIRRAGCGTESDRTSVAAVDVAGQPWDEAAVQEYDRMLGNQFQALNLFIQLLALNNQDDQDSILEINSSIKVLYQSARDAKSVRERASSRASAPGLASEADTSTVIDVLSDIDDAILPSAAYAAEYEMPLKSVVTTLSPSAATVPPPPSQASVAGSIYETSSQLTTRPNQPSTPATHKFSLSRVALPLRSRKSARSAKLLFGQLCQACRDGNAEWACHQLDAGAPVNGLDERAFSPLHYAVMGGSLELVRLLVDRGAHVNGIDGGSSATVFFAVRKDHVDVLRFLLSNGAVVNSLVCDSRDRSYRRTALSLAVENGQLESAQLLLDHGADPQVLDARGLTPLCAAANRRHLELIRLLLRHGARVDAADSHADWGSDLTALHVAAHQGFRDAVDILLDAHADVALACKRGKKLKGITALHLARGDAAEGILAREDGGRSGSGIFARDSAGQFPLTWAARRPDPAAVRALLRHGAPVNARDDADETALQIACRAFASEARDCVVDKMNDFIEVAGELGRAGASDGARTAARRIILDTCQRFVSASDLDVRPALLPLLDLMAFVADAAAEEADLMVTAPSGVRDMPRNFLSETRLAQIVTR